MESIHVELRLHEISGEIGCVQIRLDGFIERSPVYMGRLIVAEPESN